MSMEKLRHEYNGAMCSPARRMDLIEKQSREGHRHDAAELEIFLVKVLRNDSDPIVRHEAAFVLGRLKASGWISGEIAVSSLCAAACDDLSRVVRHEATEALPSFEGEEVDRTLLQLLQNDDRDIRATAAISLERRSV